MKTTAEAGWEPPMPALRVTYRRSMRERISEDWGDRRWIDWAVGVVIGIPLAIASVKLTWFGGADQSTRFAFYAGMAALLMAFVTIAFTPLAIMVTLGPGESVARLRRHGSTLAWQFLGSVLVLVATAALLLTAGLADAPEGGHTVLRTLSCVLGVVAAMKVLRLTWLFWAILSAEARDRRLGQ